ncbi:unnamed protein product [Auanema sp. JU1783]|nr:unnamed protein product [Auanema sp. JU1783]
MKLTHTIAQRVLSVIGCANGNAGRHLGCEKAAEVLRKSKYLNDISFPVKWEAMIKETVTGRHHAALQGVIKTCTDLSSATRKSIETNDETIVLGGDHSCAIGTWSGVSAAMKAKGDIGLIWVDAHMDSHTPDSTPSGNIHGMPVAHILGFGNNNLASIEGFKTKIKPENLCLVGIRSYEPPEEELLKSLGVRVFLMDEVKKRGIEDVMQEAYDLVNKNTIGFGMSIDIDGFDTLFAPAVGTPEDDGINAKEFMKCLQKLDLSRLIATEIVEFLPERDDHVNTSEKLVGTLMDVIYSTKAFQTQVNRKIFGQWAK